MRCAQPWATTHLPGAAGEWVHDCEFAVAARHSRPETRADKSQSGYKNYRRFPNTPVCSSDFRTWAPGPPGRSSPLQRCPFLRGHARPAGRGPAGVCGARCRVFERAFGIGCLAARRHHHTRCMADPALRVRAASKRVAERRNETIILISRSRCGHRSVAAFRGLDLAAAALTALRMARDACKGPSTCVIQPSVY